MLAGSYERLVGKLMRKHGITDWAEMVRRALGHFESAPVAKVPISNSLKKLETFVPTKAQRARHKEAKRRIDAGERGLDQAEGLTLLAKPQRARRAGAARKRK